MISYGRRALRSAVERIAPVFQSLQASLLIQLAKVAQDLAAVAGAERRHQLEIGGGALRERGFERLAGIPLRSRRRFSEGELRRVRHRELDAVALAERFGAIEAGLGAGAASLQRRVERHTAKARRHHEV